MTKAGDELWSQQESQASKDWSDNFMMALVSGDVPQEMFNLMGEDDDFQKVLVFLNPPGSELFG